MLSDRGASSLLGRGTRVWKAVRIVDGLECGDPVALKDAWVEGSRVREGENNERLKQSRVFVESEASFRSHFLTVECHGDVLVAGAQDCTAQLFTTVPDPDADTLQSSSSEGTGTDVTSGPDKLPRRSGSSHSQVHYRIVFKEVGLPLAEITSLRTIFKVLSDVALCECDLATQYSVRLTCSQALGPCINVGGFIAT